MQHSHEQGPLTQDMRDHQDDVVARIISACQAVPDGQHGQSMHG